MSWGPDLEGRKVGWGGWVQWKGSIGWVNGSGQWIGLDWCLDKDMDRCYKMSRNCLDGRTAHITKTPVNYVAIC